MLVASEGSREDLKIKGVETLCIANKALGTASIIGMAPQSTDLTKLCYKDRVGNSYTLFTYTKEDCRVGTQVPCSLHGS